MYILVGNFVIFYIFQNFCEIYFVIFSYFEENKTRLKFVFFLYEGYKVRQRFKLGLGLDGYDQQNKIVVLFIDFSDDED